MKPVNVGREDHEDRSNRAQGLHALHHVAAADLLNELLEETKRELFGDHVGHEKCPALRLGNSVEILGQLRLHFGLREITGKLFPERHVGRLRQFKNFTRQNALRDETHFFRERELGRIASLHETRKHLLEQRRTRS